MQFSNTQPKPQIRERWHISRVSIREHLSILAMAPSLEAGSFWSGH